MCTQCGAPNKTVTDNAQFCLGSKWTGTNKCCMECRCTPPCHQSTNCAEGEGGNHKHWLVKLLHLIPHAPIQHLCCGLDFLNSFHRLVSKDNVLLKKSQEKHWTSWMHRLAHCPLFSFFKLSSNRQQTPHAFSAQAHHCGLRSPSPATCSA